LNKNRLDLAILRGQLDFHSNGCAKWPDYSQWPDKVVIRRMERLCDKGLLDYGVSLRTAWVTDLGKEQIVVLRALLDATPSA